MDKSEPKKLSVSLGGFSCQIEGYDDPMSLLREVTSHMRELSSGDAAFLAQTDRRLSAKPGQTIQVQPKAQIAKAGTTAQAEQAGAAVQSGGNNTVQALRDMARAAPNGEAATSPGITRGRTDPSLDVVEAPEGEATTLNDQDRIDDQALSARMGQMIKTKAVPDAKSFFQQLKTETPSEKFEAGAAFLIHFQGYRHVTPKQVNRLLKRAELVGEAGLANLDELIAELMKSGRIGGNMQEGLTLGDQSPFTAERLKA